MFGFSVSITLFYSPDVTEGKSPTRNIKVGSYNYIGCPTRYRTRHFFNPCSVSQQLGALQTHSSSFLTQLTYCYSNFVAVSSLVSELLTFSRQMTLYIYIYIYICVCRTAPLTSRCCILYIYSTNIRTEYFKHAAHSPFLPLQNAVYFTMLSFFVPVLFTF